MERDRASLNRLPQGLAVQDIAAHRFDPDPAQAFDIHLSAHNRAHVAPVLAQAADDVPTDDARGPDNCDLHHPPPGAGSAPICLMRVAGS